MTADHGLLKEFKEAYRHYNRGEMKSFNECLERILLGYGDPDKIIIDVLKAIGKDIKEMSKEAI
jgi:bacterioferritin (cytochrome b1)